MRGNRPLANMVTPVFSSWLAVGQPWDILEGTRRFFLGEQHLRPIKWCLLQ